MDGCKLSRVDPNNSMSCGPNRPLSKVHGRQKEKRCPPWSFPVSGTLLVSASKNYAFLCFFLCCFSFPFESHTFALARWGKFVIMCTLICMCFVKWCFQYKKKKRTKGNSRIWERSPRWYSEVNSLQFIIGVCLVIVSISTTEDLISTLLYMFRSVNENLIGVG